MRIPARLTLIGLTLSGCFTDGSGGSDPAFAGTWEDTLYTAAPWENKTFRRVSFGPGNAYSARTTDFDKDSAGHWVDGGSLEIAGTGNTYSHVPGAADYLLLDYVFTMGGRTFPAQDLVKWELAGGKLELTKAYVLTGSSSTLQGTWRSILDSAKIDYRINKLFYSFTLTPDGKFISHHPDPDDTLDVSVSAGSFTVEDSLFIGPVTVAYHIAGGRLFLDETRTKAALTRK